MASRQERLRAYAKSVLAGSAEEGGLESLPPGGGATTEEKVESALAWTPEAKDRRADITGAFEAMRTNRDMTPAEDGALEAIILPKERPVADVKDGKITRLPPGEFASIVNDATVRERVERSMASVGCILVPSEPRLPYAGTGFVVGSGLVMTNRHVARLFADGVGTKRLSFAPGQAANFTPGREEPDATNDATFHVERVVMVHPYWDMALLEIPDLTLTPLNLSPVDPTAGRRLVVVVGYPALDPRNNIDVQNTVFNKRFFVKRVAPGYVTGRRVIDSFSNKVNAATHDASTLGGNSGSAVIDVATGTVIALHFAGVYLDTNYAVPAAELARDGRVIDAKVQFTTASRATSLPWAQRWRDVDGDGNETTAQTATAVQAVQQPGIAVRAASLSADAGGTSLRFTVPIEVTVRVGQVVTASASVAAAATAGVVDPALQPPVDVDGARVR